jgi:hypothetical protein
VTYREAYEALRRAIPDHVSWCLEVHCVVPRWQEIPDPPTWVVSLLPSPDGGPCARLDRQTATELVTAVQAAYRSPEHTPPSPLDEVGACEVRS